MTDKNLGVAGVSARQFQFVERELARLPLTEACVSGMCDLCAAQPACLLASFGGPWTGQFIPQSGQWTNKQTGAKP